MNLSKKAFLVIIPVISIFFLTATSIVYQSQKEKIVKLEHNRLKLVLAELSTLYNQYSGFSEAYLGTIIESSALKNYIRFAPSKKKKTTHIKNIERYLQGFTKHRSRFISLSIARTKPQREIIEHIELSENPLTKTPRAISDNAFLFIENDRIVQPSLLVYGNKLLLAFSALIDPETLDKPATRNKNRAYGITFAIEPSDLIDEIKRYEEDFSIQVEIRNSAPPANDKIQVMSRLDAHKYLVASYPRHMQRQHLKPTLIKLIGFSILFILACSLVVFFLVSKHLIRPITILERHIKDARANETGILSLKHVGNDEIGRLAREFSTLYLQLSKAYKHTNELVKIDQLTKLDNLYQLKKVLQALLSRAADEEKTLVFLYIDLDNFKFVNDRYGHDIGDKVLVAFSHAIIGTLNTRMPPMPDNEPSWHFGRVAGDEFGIVLSNSPSSVQVDELISDILALFAGGFSFLTGKYPISASIGVVHYPRDGETPSQLISNADKAMYQSKRMGKNRSSYYSEQIAYKIRREREVENELKNANFDEEFYLVFLPIVLTENLKIYGFESLLRWRSPRLGIVSPTEFIPIAEACGYFELIDSWVVSQSFSSYTHIRNLLGKDYILSINLSSAQIALNEIQHEILEQSRINNVPRRQVQFEMTETTNAEFSNTYDNLLNTLTDAGFKLAIDDFGTGHTALQQLVEYPASTIKFDKRFVEATMSGSGRKILKPLVELCHSQMMAVTVEGIETREQYEYMRSIDVDHLQGFLFCLPSTLAELPGALATHEKKRSSLL